MCACVTFYLPVGGCCAMYFGTLFGSSKLCRSILFVVVTDQCSHPYHMYLLLSYLQYAYKE